MLSSELYRRAITLRAVFSSNKSFFEGLDALVAAQRQVESHVAGIATNDDSNGHATRLVSFLKGLRGSLPGLDVKNFFASAGRVETGLAAYRHVQGGELTQIDAFVSEVADLTDTLNEYLKESKMPVAAELLRKASVLQAKLLTFDRYLESSIASFADTIRLEDGEELLTLQFEQSMSIDELLDRLTAIKGLVEVVQRHVLNERHSDEADQRYESSWYPARILRIETGSTEIYVAIVTAVASIVVPLLTAAVAYWHRNHTRDGILKHKVPNQISAVKQMAELLALLPKDDSRTPEMQEKLLEVCDTVLGNLGRVIEEPTNLQINGRTYEELRFDFTPVDQPRLLPRAFPNLLENPKE